MGIIFDGKNVNYMIETRNKLSYVDETFGGKLDLNVPLKNEILNL